MKISYLALCFLLACADPRIGYVAHDQKVNITLVKPIEFDTTFGVIVCVDTAKNSPDWHGNKPFWIYGYEVTTHDEVGLIHVVFLDEDKNRLRYLGWLYQIPKP